MSEAVSALEFAFERGRRDYRKASVLKEPPCPPMPPDEMDRTPEQAYYIGWMLERGMRLMKQWQARDMLGGGA